MIGPVTDLLAAYRAGRVDPSAVVARVLDRIAATPQQPVWISRVDDEALLGAARALDGADRGLALYGVPFAVKDNRLAVPLDGQAVPGDEAAARAWREAHRRRGLGARARRPRRPAHPRPLPTRHRPHHAGRRLRGRRLPLRGRGGG